MDQNMLVPISSSCGRHLGIMLHPERSFNIKFHGQIYKLIVNIVHGSKCLKMRMNGVKDLKI